LDCDDDAPVHAIGNTIGGVDQGLALAPGGGLYLSGRNAMLDQEPCNSLRSPPGQVVIEILGARQIGVTDYHELWRRPGRQDGF
jgi:hypothetical protein